MLKVNVISFRGKSNKRIILAVIGWLGLFAVIIIAVYFGVEYGRKKKGNDQGDTSPPNGTNITDAPNSEFGMYRHATVVTDTNICSKVGRWVTAPAVFYVSTLIVNKMRLFAISRYRD